MEAPEARAEIDGKRGGKPRKRTWLKVAVLAACMTFLPMMYIAYEAGRAVESAAAKEHAGETEKVSKTPPQQFGDFKLVSE